ncbi:MAG: hypothetical protein AVDCRST_MAG55-1694, partial [uncultured Rubrobacteraceae bacterium]
DGGGSRGQAARGHSGHLPPRRPEGHLHGGGLEARESNLPRVRPLRGGRGLPGRRPRRGAEDGGRGLGAWARGLRGAGGRAGLGERAGRRGGGPIPFRGCGVAV